jgi:alkanesulfonate monooxygenase
MTVDFFWRLPTHGDGRSVKASQYSRGDLVPSPRQHRFTPGQSNGAPDGFAYIDHLAQIAKAAEHNGFYGALVPTGLEGEEPWVVSAALARETKKLRFMPAFQANFIHPTYAARMGASLQRVTGDRLEWNIITGGSVQAQKAYGDFTPHDERYSRTGEFLDVVKGLWQGKPYSHKGPLYQIENGTIGPVLAQERFPGIYFSGASDAALTVAAEHADVYLMWLEPLDAVRDSIRRLNELAASRGRKIRYGVRVDLWARETEAEAWADARKLWDSLDANSPLFAQPMSSSKGGDSVGAQRQAALRPAHAKRFEDLVIGPNLWAGLGLVRPGPTVGIFGNYAQVAERLNDYIEAGIDTFILAGNPHLEEAYRVGEEVLPLLQERPVTVAREAAE